MTCQEVKPMLSAYVDGELDALNHSQVAEHLKSCPDCQKEETALLALRAKLRTVEPFAMPAGLAAKLGPKPVKNAKPWPWFGLGTLAASGVWLLAFLIVAKPFQDHTEDQILSEHIRSLMPGHLIDVQSSDRHTVKPWFLGKVSVAPETVDLSSMGFPLLGGRLDYVNSQPVPVLVYGLRKHFVSVYVFSGGHSIYPSLNGFHLTTWNYGGLDYIAVTDAGATELEAFKQAFLTSASTPG